MRGLQRGRQADVRRRMSPPHRQSGARISEEHGHSRDHDLYKMEEDLAVAGRGGAGIREGTKRLERLPTSSQWGAETAGLNAY